MNFLPMKTVYRCAKGTGTDYVKLATAYDHLTITSDFARHRFQTTDRTPFEQIKVVDFDDVADDHWQELSKVRHGKISEGRDSLLSRIRETLKATIAEHWWPGGNHVMLHSSGFDSRCISWLIRELYRERGDNWLGTILFCCTKWEGESFKDIMEYQGWRRDQYFVAGEGRENQEYYAPSLANFRDAWHWCDGALPIPVNLFWYPVAEAIENGMLSDDQPIQTWTGQFGNTVLDYSASETGFKHLDKAVRDFYKSVLCQRPMYGTEIVHPYATIELADVICGSSITLGKHLRPHFVASLDEGLASFRNVNSDGDRHRHIADWLMAQVRSDYKHSWYGHNVAPLASPKYATTEFQDFWYHWSLASFCDELRRRGIDIT